MSKRCSAICANGNPCKAWAVRGSDPPLCAAHGGGKASVGAPAGNQNATTHGFYQATHPHHPLQTIDDIYADLAEKQANLSDYIDTHLYDLDLSDITRLLALHAQTASRLGRLLRDRRAISGEAADGISGAIAQALDELSTELKTEIDL